MLQKHWMNFDEQVCERELVRCHMLTASKLFFSQGALTSVGVGVGGGGAQTYKLTTVAMVTGLDTFA